MHHSTNNLFFGYLSNGSVRILKLNTTPDEWPRMGWGFPGEALFDSTLTAEQWAGVVKYVKEQEDLQAKPKKA